MPWSIYGGMTQLSVLSYCICSLGIGVNIKRELLNAEKYKA